MSRFSQFALALFLGLAGAANAQRAPSHLQGLTAEMLAAIRPELEQRYRRDPVLTRAYDFIQSAGLFQGGPVQETGGPFIEALAAAMQAATGRPGLDGALDEAQRWLIDDGPVLGRLDAYSALAALAQRAGRPSVPAAQAGVLEQNIRTAFQRIWHGQPRRFGARHGDARRVSMQWDAVASRFALDVEDDGAADREAFRLSVSGRVRPVLAAGGRYRLTVAQPSEIVLSRGEAARLGPKTLAKTLLERERMLTDVTDARTHVWLDPRSGETVETATLNERPAGFEYLGEDNRVENADDVIATLRSEIAELLGDTDGDGVSDLDEVTKYRTNPTLADTDGDLIPDGVEIRALESNAVRRDVRFSLDPLRANNVNGDTDGDGLSDIDELRFQTDLLNDDTDGDGVADGAEVAQGSSTTDATDGGVAPPASELVDIRLKVGDSSGSHSERYNLIVGSIAHQAPEFGEVSERVYKFRRGASYRVTLVHTGTKPGLQTDLDYEAHVTPVVADSTVVIEDPDRLLGSHSDDRTFAAKSATLHVYDRVSVRIRRGAGPGPGPSVPQLVADDPFFVDVIVGQEEAARIGGTLTVSCRTVGNDSGSLTLKHLGAARGPVTYSHDAPVTIEGGGDGEGWFGIFGDLEALTVRDGDVFEVSYGTAIARAEVFTHSRRLIIANFRREFTALAALFGNWLTQPGLTREAQRVVHGKMRLAQNALALLDYQPTHEERFRFSEHARVRVGQSYRALIEQDCSGWRQPSRSFAHFGVPAHFVEEYEEISRALAAAENDRRDATLRGVADLTITGYQVVAEMSGGGSVVAVLFGHDAMGRRLNVTERVLAGIDLGTQALLLGAEVGAGLRAARRRPDAARAVEPGVVRHRSRVPGSAAAPEVAGVRRRTVEPLSAIEDRVVERARLENTNGAKYRRLRQSGMSRERARELMEAGLVCFLPGTLVATPSGERPIEQLAAGDEVIAWDENRGAAVIGRVEALLRGTTARICEVTLEASAAADGPLAVISATGSTQTLRCTPGHDFYRVQSDEWVDAERLASGDLLRTADGRTVRVRAVRVGAQDSPTVNLKVEPWPVYFVSGAPGAAAVLVHNHGCPKAGTPEHRALRWEQYQKRRGANAWPYERWSKVYEENMARAKKAAQPVDDYHKQLGSGAREVVVDAGGIERRLDIADARPNHKWGIEYKTGYVRLTDEILWEIERDAALMKRGWKIEWVINGNASEGVLSMLEASDIPYKFTE